MTLRVRLAAMMVAILVAVLALQYLLMERDRQETMSRLTELGSGLDRSTALFVEEIRDLSLSPRKDGLTEFLRSFAGHETFSANEAQVTVVVWADSSHLASNGGDPAGSFQLEWFEGRLDSLGFEAEVGFPAGAGEVSSLLRQTDRCDSIVVETYRDGERRILVQSSITSDSLTESLAGSLLAQAGPRNGPVRSYASRQLAGGGHDVVVNLPIPAAASDSFVSVQVRYPLDTIQKELGAQRRRSLLWLGSVLGVGVLGAFLVAGQFTRPLRSLQASFRRVEEGDLSVHVEPERSDEIGRLTDSFNEMVDRLRESREVESRLGESERLATLGRLAAGVAHEIRNPLNAIQLTALQMRDVARRGRDANDPTGGQLDRYYQLVSGEVQRLERLVGAFLDLTRDEKLARTLLDGTQSLSASVELFRPEAEARGIRIEFDSTGAVPILADPTRLPAVWNNLLSNALAASPEGSVIRVQAASSPGEFVVVVGDSGPGVSEADRSRIWEPFFSGRPAGTGLGLSIVRAVVERHQGTVRLLESEQGAAFEVRIPREGAPGEAGIHPSPDMEEGA